MSAREQALFVMLVFVPVIIALGWALGTLFGKAAQ